MGLLFVVFDSLLVQMRSSRVSKDILISKATPKAARFTRQ